MQLRAHLIYALVTSSLIAKPEESKVFIVVVKAVEAAGRVSAADEDETVNTNPEPNKIEASPELFAT
jgi:hypothetical protein